MERELHGSALAVYLGSLSMLSAFSISAVLPSLQSLQLHFEIGPSQAQYATTVYLIAYSATCAIHGPVSDILGRTQVIRWGLVLYLLASVGCSFAGSFAEFLFWRSGQGLTAGVGAVVGRALIGDVATGQHGGRLHSQTTAVYSAAPIAAPVIGAVLTVAAGWKGVFSLLTFFAFALLVMSLRLPKPKVEPCIGDQRSEKAISVIFDPLIQRYCWGLALGYASWWTLIAASPQLADQVALDRPVAVMLIVMPLVLGAAFGSILAARMARGTEANTQLKTGRVISTAGVLLLVVSTISGLGLYGLLLPLAMHAVGAAVVFPVALSRMLSLYPNRRGLASSLQASSTLVATASAVSILLPALSGDVTGFAVSAILMASVSLAFLR